MLPKPSELPSPLLQSLLLGPSEAHWEADGWGAKGWRTGGTQPEGPLLLPAVQGLSVVDT